jgi:hypothetical protein
MAFVREICFEAICFINNNILPFKKQMASFLAMTAKP